MYLWRHYKSSNRQQLLLAQGIQEKVDLNLTFRILRRTRILQTHLHRILERRADTSTSRVKLGDTPGDGCAFRQTSAL